MTGLSWLRGSEVYSHDQLIPFLLGLVKQNIKVQAQGDKVMDNIVAMDRGKREESGTRSYFKAHTNPTPSHPPTPSTHPNELDLSSHQLPIPPSNLKPSMD